MNTHALGVLELHRVLGIVAERAKSELARAATRMLAPRADRAWVQREHARVTAMRALVESQRGWGPEAVIDVQPALERVAIAGTWLEPRELVDVATVARSSRVTRDEIRHPERPAVARAQLASFVERLTAARDLEDAVARSIDAEGNVLDTASPRLREIRAELRDAETRLVRLLERVLSGVEDQFRVPDMSITIRNGRYVIPIRREGRTAVGGIVHDASATEATLFVEPPAAVEFGNRVRELEEEERREIIRVLQDLTDLVRPYAAELSTALDALVELETLFARARFAVDFDCAPVDFGSPEDGFVIARGRHPLLTVQGTAVVPFDLAMAAGERTLLVSGPNTGGKTVLLKAIGLFTLMAQSGVPVPVAPRSRLAIYDDVYADIGDEQSIEASLSTFSAHVRNLRDVLQGATKSSLVLIDELGSGTDPAEGAALAGAILEDLTTRGAMTVATTHLGALKLLATDHAGIVNASLQFDAGALAPTYQLVKGQPGRSYGLSIARRLLVPETIIARAEDRLSEGERDVAALLEDLERRERLLKTREEELDAMLAEARDRSSRLAEREDSVRQRERELQREGRNQARKYLLEARAAVEETIRDVRRAREGEVAERARAARQAIEQRAAEESRALEELTESASTKPAPDETAVGDWVELESLGGVRARVLERRGEDLVVAAGALRMTVPRASARRAAPIAAGAAPVALRGDMPEVAVKPEIDVRGMRADEVEDAVMHAVDSAIRADLRSLRIIHGKGTGALRDRVREMLQKEARVANFRLGAWNEGGAGVTIAEFE